MGCFGHVGPPWVTDVCVCGRLADMARDVHECSFIDFWSKYEFKSAGRPANSQKKRCKNQIVEVMKPLVAVPKPAVANAWSQPGHASRAWYCECMLKRHKPFIGKEAFITYMDGHNWDFEAAFQTFAASSQAPMAVKDAFAKWAHLSCRLLLTSS